MYLLNPQIHDTYVFQFKNIKYSKYDAGKKLVQNGFES